MRALCTILPCSLTIWSWHLSSSRRQATYLLATVSKPTQPRVDLLARAVAAHGADRPVGCSRPLFAVCRIGLADLELAHRSGNAGTWAMALAEADVLLRNGIRCFPYDGNLWLRLAVVEFARKGPATDVAQLLTLSAMTAPSEAWIVGPRVAFAARLSELGSTEVRRVLESDILTVVAQARTRSERALSQGRRSSAPDFRRQHCLARRGSAVRAQPHDRIGLEDAAPERQP